ncbi:MAG: adenylosuccinate synthetase [Sulfolobales archaeon]
MITIICGGFFGDEGKGKVAGYIGLKGGYAAAIRTGSINAGHTVVYNGMTWKLRIVPSAFVNKDLRLYIARGSLVKIDVLLREISETGVAGRICVDRYAGIIEDRHVEAEKRDDILRGIGSTFQGVGAATAERVLRRLKLAWEFKELEPFLCDSVSEILELNDKGLRTMVEGTQGLYLSLYHGTYPYVTSRDVSASGILSEAGLGPKYVEDIIVVFKSYITRVGEGPLEGELSLEEIERLGLVERGTVTGRLRRVAPFNIELAKRAVKINSATQIAITKIDALFRDARGVREWGKLPPEARRFIEDIEDRLGVPITLISTGEDLREIVDLRREKGFEPS